MIHLSARNTLSHYDYVELESVRSDQYDPDRPFPREDILASSLRTMMKRIDSALHRGLIKTQLDAAIVSEMVKQSMIEVAQDYLECTWVFDNILDMGENEALCQALRGTEEE